MTSERQSDCHRRSVRKPSSPGAEQRSGLKDRASQSPSSGSTNMKSVCVLETGGITKHSAGDNKAAWTLLLTRTDSESHFQFDRRSETAFRTDRLISELLTGREGKRREIFQRLVPSYIFRSGTMRRSQQRRLAKGPRRIEMTAILS